MEVASRAIVRTEVAGSVEREPRLRGRREIRRAADEPRDALRDRVQHLTRRVAAREALRVGREVRDRHLPGFGKLAALHALDLVRQVRVRRAVLLEQLLPVRASFRPARADPLGEVLADAVGDEELGVLRPAVEALRGPDTLRAERLAVRLRRVLDGGAVADVTVHDDQRRPLVFGLEGVKRALGLLEVVRVRDCLDVPAVCDEAARHVLGEREIGMPFDRDPVRVVDPAEVREALVRGERCRLRGDALHHAAVARLGVDVEVEQREAVAVVTRSEPLACDCHPDRGGDALAQRARGRLDAARPAVLGVARALRAELPEPLEVVE